jgi:GH25 family lysozyme M1 (1,4-beta-N-acetylmuramidase)
MKIGIDVSSYQGNIDWNKVKSDGVEFAILKVIRKDLNPDKQFENNWKGCKEVGLPVLSIYNYSYATTVSKGVGDAIEVLKILNGRKAKVCLDVEDACQKGLGSLLIDIINAYADVILSAGLDFCVYTGWSFYNTYIKPFGGIKHPLWIAKYYQNTGSFVESNKPNVSNMIGWQFTSKGRVNGINGNVDMNIWYEKMEGDKMKTRSAVVSLAQTWIGKKESDGSHKSIIDIYNSYKPHPRGYELKYTDAWCAGTVSALSIKLGYTDIIPVECSCQKMIELFKGLGSWIEDENRTPKAGDIIFYDWQDSGSGDNQGWSDHVGIVEKVSGTTITVIEGNYDNAVKRRTLQVNGKYIRGYGIPKYDAESETQTSEKKSITEIAKEVLAGKWGNGSERKRRLIQAGYDYSSVQEKVNELASTSKKKSVTEIAKEVIQGKWGNGADRKSALEKAGYDYETIQKKVNELL